MNLKQALAAAALCASGAAHALSMEALANATVQPAGVRSGSSGLAFFNVEGSDNGSFASYGAVRFDLSAVRSQLNAQFGAGGWVVDSVQLLLTQSNAGFTTDGLVDIYFSASDTVSLTPPSPLTYGGFATDFAGATLAMGYAFTEFASGYVETHTLFSRGGSNSAGGNAIAADVLADEFTTLVLRDASAGVAATYAGHSNFSYSGPTLAIEAVAAVPEPATSVLLLCGAGVVAAARRRRLAC